MTDNDKDIDTLYSKVNDHESRLTKVETATPFLQEVLKKNVETNETLSNTLHEVQVSMVKISSQMDEQRESTAQMRDDFTEANTALRKEISTINNKVDIIEEKTKFDIMLFIKKNWPLILVLLGLGAEYLSSKI